MRKILILYGGNSPEHEVSKKSAKSIIDNIDSKLYDTDMVYINKNNEWFKHNDLSKIDNIIEYLKKYDVIFPVTHGANGEDGKLQGLLDLFNIDYVGSKTTASAVTMDKTLTKIILDKYGIPTVPYIIINEKYNIKDIEILDYPLIIKPANGGSSIGINKANNRKELLYSINEALKYDKKILIEKFINARELECAILDNKKLIASTVGEIIPTNEFYDFSAKYEKPSKIIIPADIPKHLIKYIKKIAKESFKILNLKTYSRIDFLYDKDKETLYLNEINTLPGFTNISMYPKLFENEGINYKKLITLLIEASVSK